MQERPTLNRQLDSTTFRDFYWLKEELVDFCRNNGLSTAGGKYEKYIPIDIEVLEEHGKRGVAIALTSAFVKRCIECDLIPHWDCVESNTGSIRLAESIGFEKIKERPF